MTVSSSKPPVRWSERAWLAACGTAFTGMGLWIFVVAIRKDPGAVALLVSFGLLALGGFCLWRAVAYRSLSPAELEALDTLPLPEHSANALVCRFRWFTRLPRLVVVDFDRERAYFRNCHVPRKFLAVAEHEFRCAFADLIAVYRYQRNGDSLTIVTKQGKALIPPTATDYEALCARLPRCVPADAQPLDAEHPLIGMAYTAGAIAGLFLGLIAVPQNASISVVAAAMAVGAACGISLVQALVLLINRTLRRTIVPALGSGALGLVLGWTLADRLTADIPHATEYTLAASLLTGLVGFLVGLVLTKPRPDEAPGRGAARANRRSNLDATGVSERGPNDGRS